MGIDDLLLNERGRFAFLGWVRRHVHDKRGKHGRKGLGGRTETGSLSPLAFFLLFLSLLSFISSGLWELR